MRSLSEPGETNELMPWIARSLQKGNNEVAPFGESHKALSQRVLTGRTTSASIEGVLLTEKGCKGGYHLSWSITAQAADIEDRAKTEVI